MVLKRKIQADFERIIALCACPSTCDEVAVECGDGGESNASWRQISIMEDERECLLTEREESHFVCRSCVKRSVRK